MKFPQIFMLMVLFCAMVFSCRDTTNKEGKSPASEQTIPSAEKQLKAKPTPKNSNPNPSEISRDSVEKKQRKSRGLDSLKPKVAMLE